MKQALTGGAYQAHSVIASAQRSLNLYAEPMPEAQGEPMPAAHYPTPGLRQIGNVGTGPIRGIRQCTGGQVYVVSGHTLYSVDPSTWAGTAIGDITSGLRTPVSMQDNGLDMLIVDGSANGWDVSLAANTMAAISDPSGMFTGADRVDYLDTFFLFNKPGTPQFYISGSLAVTFDALDFANKEAYSDLLVVAVVAKRLVYLFGERTTEIWYDAGATDIGAGSFPFAAMQSEVFIDHGCVAKYSPAVYDNTVFWLTRDRQGQGIVMMVSGYQTKRVSTYAIEAEIAGYATVSDAIGFTYQLAGHSFYVLTFPQADHTWSYDITTGLWHEWLWIDANGDEHRHRGNAFWPVNDTLVVGDWQNGNLYALDNREFTDNGSPIKRVRSFPHMLADGRRVFYRQFLADMETGWAPQEVVTRTTTVPGTIPTTRQIAQLIVPSDGLGSPLAAAVDWTRGKVYLWQQSPAAVRIYTTSVATQSPALSATLSAGTIIYGVDVDPVSGSLIIQDGSGLNGAPVHKYDAASLALLGTFGTSTSFPAYPASIWVGQALVCVAVSGVGYAVDKQSEASGVVSVIRTDNMTAAGFSATVVSGATNNRAIMCGGASGGARGSVFLTWQGSVNGATPTIPLYTVVITAGAETYNPATWPATNPHISSATVGSIAAWAVDPSWTVLLANTIGYDATDGNVLLDVTTTNVVPNQHYVIKVNAASGAVMWRVPMGNTGAATQLGEYRISSGSAAALPVGLRDVITTGTGALISLPMSGLTMTNGFAAGDDGSGLLVLKTVFAAGGTSPTPVAGTPSSFTGWAILGGVYPNPPTVTTTTSPAPPSLISLRWSDDRGHSWGSPVTQPIGASGAYRTSLQWQRLAYARDRCFELSWSIAMRTALQGAWIDATPAQS